MYPLLQLPQAAPVYPGLQSQYATTVPMQCPWPLHATIDLDTGHWLVDTRQSCWHKDVELTDVADLDASPSSHAPLPHSAARSTVTWDAQGLRPTTRRPTIESSDRPVDRVWEMFITAEGAAVADWITVWEAWPLVSESLGEVLRTTAVLEGAAVGDSAPTGPGLGPPVEALTASAGGRASENISVRRSGPSGTTTRSRTLPSSTPSAAASTGIPITTTELPLAGFVDAPPVPASTSLTTSPWPTPVAFSVTNTVARHALLPPHTPQLSTWAPTQHMPDGGSGVEQHTPHASTATLVPLHTPHASTRAFTQQ